MAVAEKFGHQLKKEEELITLLAASFNTMEPVDKMEGTVLSKENSSARLYFKIAYYLQTWRSQQEQKDIED